MLVTTCERGLGCAHVSFRGSFMAELCISIGVADVRSIFFDRSKVTCYVTIPIISMHIYFGGRGYIIWLLKIWARWLLLTWHDQFVELSKRLHTVERGLIPAFNGVEVFLRVRFETLVILALTFITRVEFTEDAILLQLVNYVLTSLSSSSSRHTNIHCLCSLHLRRSRHMQTSRNIGGATELLTPVVLWRLNHEF